MTPKKINPRSSLINSLKKTDLESVLFFLVVLFLPTQLGRHFWPDYSYIYSLKIDYLSPTFYFWDALTILLVTTWVLKRPYVNKASWVCLLIFLSSQGLSLISAQNVGAGFVRLEQYFITGIFGVYLSSSNFSKIKMPLYIGSLSALTLESAFAVLQFLKGGSIGVWILGERSFSLSTPSIASFNFYGKIFLRPYGTFPHPNVLAGYIALTLPITVFLSSVIKKFVTFKKVALLLAFVSGLLSFSRVSIVLFIAQAFLYFKNKRALLAIFLVILFPIIFTRFNSAFNFDNLSFIRREELAEIALIQLKANPILGSGLNNFINQVSSSSLISGPSRFLQPVHNIFLLTLAEAGILGFLGFLTLLGYPLYKMWHYKKLTYFQYLLMSWEAFILLGMFDHYFLTLPQGQRIFFLVWGLSMLEYSSGNSKKDYSPSSESRFKKSIQSKYISADR